MTTTSLSHIIFSAALLTIVVVEEVDEVDSLVLKELTIS